MSSLVASADGSAVDWRRIDLVIFDLDGTLYDQARLRRRMAVELAGACARAQSLDLVRILKSFRAGRELLAEERRDDFPRLQYERVQHRTGTPAGEIANVVREWMQERPLRHLPSCRYAGVAELFAALKSAGRTIAVLSDYPAHAKLSALGLSADIIVAAGDAGAPRLKPDSAGVQFILAEAGVPAARALMIGDRDERDGEAARGAGVVALIRAGRPIPNVLTFRHFNDPVFRGIDPV